jgi:outer membrane protein assembly factor BamB
VVGSVTVGSEGRIHVACEGGKLYTLNAEGKPLWVHDANTPLLSAPTIGSDGVLYVGGRDGRLFSISPEGQLRWAHHTDGAIYSSPAVGSNGQVYVGSTDGILRALDVGTGEELWRFKTKGPGALPNGAIFASPSIGLDGTVYAAGLYDPNLYALNSVDGSVKWACRFPANSNDPNAGGWPFASPVVAEDGTIYQALLYDRHLYAIDPATGAILWSAEFPDLEIPVMPGLTVPADGDGWSEPVLGPDGTIYVSLDDLHIHAVEPTGKVKWSKAFGQVGAFTMVVDRTNTIYAASDDGFLYVVASDGTELARFETGGWPVFPVIAAANLLILANSKDYSSLEKGVKNSVWAIETGDME